MSIYGEQFSADTPQTSPAIGKDQVENNAGGYVFEIDLWKRLHRFLILGTEGGTFYLNEKLHTYDNVQVVMEAVRVDGGRVVSILIEIAKDRRAVRAGPVLFTLAYALKRGNVSTRFAAMKAINSILTNGSMFLAFVADVDRLGGWGPFTRNAVSYWYQGHETSWLEYQVSKYQSRGGWSHRDVLRMTHPAVQEGPKNEVLRWALGRPANTTFPPLIAAVEAMKSAEDTSTVLELIRANRLVHEQVPTKWLSNPVVWEALLDSMPPLALIRRLGQLTSIGTLMPLTPRIVEIERRIIEGAAREKIHPLSLLLALRIYQSGRGDKGSLKWEPIPQIVSALETAFHASFSGVEPTGKRVYIGLDVSGSMTSRLMGTAITCREAAAALTLSMVKREPMCVVGAFQDSIRPLDVRPSDSFSDVMARTNNLDFGSTDCAQPMWDAIKRKLGVDAFIVITDNETWSGHGHPFQALKKYREKMGVPNAKLAVVGMTATKFSIADPSDPGMMDFVGFDAALPEALNAFLVE